MSFIIDAYISVVIKGECCSYRQSLKVPFPLSALILSGLLLLPSANVDITSLRTCSLIAYYIRGPC